MFSFIKRRWRRFTRGVRFSTELLTFLGVALSIPLWFHSCGAPRLDINSHEGRRAIIEATRLALSEENCTKAIELIEPLYGSQWVDNDIRMLRASAHACNTGINFFGMLADLIEQKDNLSSTGGAFYATVTRLFPSDFTEDRLQSSWFAADALMATLDEGTTVPDIYANGSGNNRGSVIARQRTNDSNALMALVGMATLGETQHRYGFNDPTAPQGDYLQQQDLPWTTEALMSEEGCAYAGAFMHMLDSFEQMSVSNDKLDSISTAVRTIKGGIGNACVLGCLGAGGGGFATGCALTAAECTPVGDCTDPLNIGACDVPCPYEMRSRDRCLNNTAARCAAAGIINYINSDLGWQCEGGAC